jgi:hypothetical protein
MIRLFVAVGIPILVTGCAQQSASRDYAALADWNYRAVAPRRPVEHVAAADKNKIAKLEDAPARDDPSTTASIIDRSSPLWTLELSAEQDPENQRLKRIIKICSGC